jgi:hypothetical protein
MLQNPFWHKLQACISGMKRKLANEKIGKLENYFQKPVAAARLYRMVFSG